VRVLDLWWEDSFDPRRAEGFVDAMRDALRAYLRFAGAGRVEWAPPLGNEKRLFLIRP
jgi:plasmid stabilization system protein ParE